MSSSIRLTDMTRTPLEVEVGQLKLKLSPPTLADLAELDRFVGRRHLDEAKAFIEDAGDILGDDVRQQLLREAFQKGQDSMESVQSMASMGANLANTAYLIFLCARHNDDKLTCEQIMEAITASDMARLGEAMSELTGGKGSAESASEPTPETMKSTGV